MTYVSKTDVVSFFNKIYPAMAVADIDDITLAATAEMIDNETNTQWVLDAVDKTVYLDGNNSDAVYSEITPIASLTSVVIVKPDLEEVTLDFVGSDRNAWYDSATGKFEIIKSQTLGIEITGGDDLFAGFGQLFNKGVRNIEITGKFGRSTPDLVKLLQLWLIGKDLSMTNPTKFKFDLLEETIGRYKYKIGTPSGQSDRNQKRGLDGYINWLFELLPHDDQLGIEAI